MLHATFVFDERLAASVNQLVIGRVGGLIVVRNCSWLWAGTKPHVKKSNANPDAKYSGGTTTEKTPTSRQTYANSNNGYFFRLFFQLSRSMPYVVAYKCFESISHTAYAIRRLPESSKYFCRAS